MERLELVKIDYRNRDEKLIEPDFDEEVAHLLMLTSTSLSCVKFIQLSQIRDLHIMQ